MLFLSNNRDFFNETTKFLFKQIMFRISICYFNETNFSQINRNTKSKETFFSVIYTYENCVNKIIFLFTLFVIKN